LNRISNTKLLKSRNLYGPSDRMFSIQNSSILRLWTWTLMSIVIILSTSVNGTRKEGIFESLRGYMSEMGNVVNDVVSGMEKLGKGIKNVEEFLDATIDEECIFECPNGGEFQSNPDHSATSNGCGSFGLEDFLTSDVLPLDEFVECCNGHDICYGSCGNDKDECDLKFKKCLYRKCSAEKHTMSKLQHRGCQAGAKILYTGTTALGCKSFINSQKDACLCQKENSKFKGHHPKDEF